MRYCDSIFGHLLKPLSRRCFQAIVDRHDGDAYDKSFDSWSHLVALIFAQLSGVCGLRGLEASWNAHAHHHYHLGVGRLHRATLSDANQRRPTEIFAETFAMLSRQADRQVRRDGAAMLRLLDATPIPLDTLCGWSDFNGRTRGLKLHVVYDPVADHPRDVAITASTVNDVMVGRQQPIEARATYVFDKGYCDYAWWTRIHQAKARFVTRPKTNARYRLVRRRKLGERTGDGFTVIDDALVSLATQGQSRLAIPLRRIRLRRQDGRILTLITNDLERSAVKIAALYKARWQIELLFRWIKQHLELRKFLGRSQNAIRLQIMGAMIAFLLLRIAARLSRSSLAAVRFVQLVSACLFVRKPIHRLDKPPTDSPSKQKPRHDPNQLDFCYA
jgi:putative transposase